MDNNLKTTNINFYPGHMAKARRLIAEKYPLIDIVGSATGGPLKAICYYNTDFCREVLCQDSNKFQFLEDTYLGA